MNFYIKWEWQGNIFDGFFSLMTGNGTRVPGAQCPVPVGPGLHQYVRFQPPGRPKI
jgi:hypothetical protein